MKLKDKQALPSDPLDIAREVYARWYFGHPASRVDMPERDEDAGALAGSLIAYELPYLASGFRDRQYGEYYRCSGIVRAETLLVVLAAGRLGKTADRAEAHVRTVGGASKEIDASGGAVLQRAREVAADWLPGCFDDAWDLASDRARVLVSTPYAAAAISDMAGLLAAKKWLEEDEVDGLCLLAFHGRKPCYDAWCESWPPTLAQLRATHVPLFDDDREAITTRAERSRNLAWYLATVAPRVLAPEQARM